MKRVTWDRGLD